MKHRHIFTFSLLFVLPPALAQEPGQVAGQEAEDKILEGHSHQSHAFNEGPRQAAYLMGGTSNISFPVNTVSEEAQRFFDQGVGQLHGFWYFEAERSFRQVALIDPDCAMAYWGMTMANINNPDRAAGLIYQALIRRDQATEKGRMWIDAFAKYYDITTDDEPGPRPEGEAAARRNRPAGRTRDQEGRALRNLVRDMEAILRFDPDDIETKAFLSLQVWENGRRGVPISSHQLIDRMLDDVFAGNPMHPAHHYRIHLWDNEKAEIALPSAARIGQSAPAIAHMWHMGGHILAKLDRHGDAAWQQEASARVDHARMIRDRVMLYQIHNYGHNNEWLTRSLSHVGRVNEALAVSSNMVEQPRHPTENRIESRGSIAGYGRTRLFEVPVIYEMWDKLIELCDSEYLQPTDVEGEQAKRLSLLGQAYFMNGDMSRGEEQLSALEDLLKEIEAREAMEATANEAEGNTDEAGNGGNRGGRGGRGGEGRGARGGRGGGFGGGNRTNDSLLASLRGYKLLAEGDPEAALEEFENVNRMREDVLAEMYLKAGKVEEAIEKIEEAVADNPEMLPQLVRKTLILDAAGKKEEAAATFEEVRALAVEADLDVPLLQRLSPLAAELGLPADWRLPKVDADDVGVRPDVTSLGPLRWAPSVAPDWTLPSPDGGNISLSDYRGSPVLVIFYLGFGCLHCVEQLEMFSPVADQYLEEGIEMVAIGTDGLAGARKSIADLGADGQLAFPLAADPQMNIFKLYRTYDNFEDLPLHGTFLIDADGLIRWGDISYEPFTEPEFLLQESIRLLAMEKPAVKTDDRR